MFKLSVLILGTITCKSFIKLELDIESLSVSLLSFDDTSVSIVVSVSWEVGSEDSIDFLDVMLSDCSLVLSLGWSFSFAFFLEGVLFFASSRGLLRTLLGEELSFSLALLVDFRSLLSGSSIITSVIWIDGLEVDGNSAVILKANIFIFDR